MLRRLWEKKSKAGKTHEKKKVEHEAKKKGRLREKGKGMRKKKKKWKKGRRRTGRGSTPRAGGHGDQEKQSSKRGEMHHQGRRVGFGGREKKNQHGGNRFVGSGEKTRARRGNDYCSSGPRKGGLTQAKLID